MNRFQTDNKIIERGRRRHVFLTVLLGLISTAFLLTACTRSPAEIEIHDPNIIAVFDEGQVTTSDLDASILQLPPAERRLPGEGHATWLESLARRLAVESLLLRWADESGIAQGPEFVSGLERVRSHLRSQICRQRLLPAIEPVTREDVLREYEARKEQYHRQESRQVFNLFRRASQGASAAAIRGELDELRDRTLNGEPFPQLAAQNSDSESRFENGLIGWVQRGQLEPDLERVVFSLDEGVPSEPIMTADGGHLFFVQKVFSEKQYNLQEVGETLYRQLVAERRAQAVSKFVGAIDPPSDSVILSQEDFERIVASDEPDTVVLRIADTEISLDQLLKRTAQAARQAEPSEPPASPWQFLGRLTQGELLANECRVRALVTEAELDTGMAAQRQGALLAKARSDRMRQYVEHDHQRLQEFFDANSNRFMTSPRWKIRRLAVPFGDDPVALATRLERAREALDAGALDLKALATETGGLVDDLGWMTLAEIRSAVPRLARLLTSIEDGHHTGVVRTTNNLEIVQVISHEEPRIRTLDESWDAVVDAYLSRYHQEVYDQIAEEILSEARFKVLTNHLDAFVRNAEMEPEINLDALDEALGLS